jgi:hypothetical protein
MSDKFRVTVTKGLWQDKWPDYFDNFIKHCEAKSNETGWLSETVITHELKPHGRLIKTKTQGWYLRWDDEKYHNMFVLRWS